MQQVVERAAVRRVPDHQDPAAVPLGFEVPQEKTGPIDDLTVALAAREGLVDVHRADSSTSETGRPLSAP